MAKRKTAKRLTRGIATIIALTFCLIVTTFALVWVEVSVDNNTFHTGKISINLNDGKAIIREDEYNFEPGMTVEKQFFIKNESTFSIYYKLYLDEVSGGLADVLELSIKDGDKVLYTGTANELKKENGSAAIDVLEINEKKILTFVFYFPKEKGNEAQKMDLSFTLCADGVQTKNNPSKEFD